MTRKVNLRCPRGARTPWRSPAPPEEVSRFLGLVVVNAKDYAGKDIQEFDFEGLIPTPQSLRDTEAGPGGA